MLSDVLFAFFVIAPPAIVAIIAHEQASPLAKGLMLWGGSLAALLLAIALLPSLACGGGLYADFEACMGGAAVTDTANTMAPISRMILIAYVWTAPAFAFLCFLLNWLHGRRAI